MDNQLPPPTRVLCQECGRSFCNTQGLGSHRVFTHQRPTTTSKAQARDAPPVRPSTAPGERHIPPTGPATPALHIWPSSSYAVASGHICGVVLLFSPAAPHTAFQQPPPLLYTTPCTATSPSFHTTISSGQGSLVRTLCSSVLLPTFLLLFTPGSWWQVGPTDDAGRTYNDQPLLPVWDEREEHDFIEWLVD
jgi:hypothetical protein